MQKLRMEHIYKSYGQAVVLQDFSYAFTPGGITCIMGESGAGKTTLLRGLKRQIPVLLPDLIKYRRFFRRTV